MLLSLEDNLSDFKYFTMEWQIIITIFEIWLFWFELSWLHFYFMSRWRFFLLHDCFSVLCHVEGFFYFHLQNSSNSYYWILIIYYPVFHLSIQSNYFVIVLFFRRSKGFSIMICFCYSSVLIKEICFDKNEIWDFNKIFMNNFLKLTYHHS